MHRNELPVWFLETCVSAQTRLCVWLMTRDDGAVLSSTEAEEGRVRTSDLRSRARFLLQGSGAASLIRATAWQRQRVLQMRKGKKFAASMIWNKQPCGSREALCELCTLSLKTKYGGQCLWRFGDGREFSSSTPTSESQRVWRLLPTESMSSKLSPLCSCHHHQNCIPPSWSTPTDDDNIWCGILNGDFTLC